VVCILVVYERVFQVHAENHIEIVSIIGQLRIVVHGHVCLLSFTLNIFKSARTRCEVHRTPISPKSIPVFGTRFSLV